MTKHSFLLLILTTLLFFFENVNSLKFYGDPDVDVSTAYDDFHYPAEEPEERKNAIVRITNVPTHISSIISKFILSLSFTENSHTYLFNKLKIHTLSLSFTENSHSHRFNTLKIHTLYLHNNLIAGSEPDRNTKRHSDDFDT